MRTFVVVCWLLGGCHATTVDQEQTRDACQIICDCGFFPQNQGITPANCVNQCTSGIGSSLPDTCIACLYEFEHTCGALVVQCEPACSSSRPVQTVDGGIP